MTSIAGRSTPFVHHFQRGESGTARYGVLERDGLQGFTLCRAQVPIRSLYRYLRTSQETKMTALPCLETQLPCSRRAIFASPPPLGPWSSGSGTFPCLTRKLLQKVPLTYQVGAFASSWVTYYRILAAIETQNLSLSIIIRVSTCRGTRAACSIGPVCPEGPARINGEWAVSNAISSSNERPSTPLALQTQPPSPARQLPSTRHAVGKRGARKGDP